MVAVDLVEEGNGSEEMEMDVRVKEMRKDVG